MGQFYGAPRSDDLGKNRFSTVVDSGTVLTIRVAYNAAGNEEYIGVAAPGAAEDAPVWLIRKLGYTVNSQVESVKYAGAATTGKAVFGYTWSDRATHTYA